MEEKTKPQSSLKDVYSIVTDRIIALLEKGTVPWRMPWTRAGLPHNFVTKRNYRGINVYLLAMLGYEHNAFLTVNQLKDEFNGKVKQGEKGTPVVFWNWKDVTDEDSKETKQVPFLRYYMVFNVAQCEGIPENQFPAPEVLTKKGTIEACEKIIESMPKRPEVKFKEQRAYYHPLLDYINMPKLKTFESSERFYETYFHELIHSTGHITRLNRKELMEMEEFGGESYSIEELIAEMGASFLKSLCDFAPEFEQHAAYIQGWLNKLKNDKHFVIYAAGKAQNAVDYILNDKVDGGTERNKGISGMSETLV